MIFIPVKETKTDVEFELMDDDNLLSKYYDVLVKCDLEKIAQFEQVEDCYFFIIYEKDLKAL